MTDQFDLLKSHIDAYTRKDGTVVSAHDDKRVHHEGDSVKVTGNVNGQGKTGVIHETAPSGHFHIVKHSDGSKASYHESDLSPHDEDDEDDEDDRDRDYDEGDDHHVLKAHIEAYTRKDGAVVQAHDDKRVANNDPKSMHAKHLDSAFRRSKKSALGLIGTRKRL
jgi:hypothetical protein